MKLRKAIALLAAILMIAGLPAAAFADGNFGDETAQHNRDIAGDAPFTLDGDNNDGTGGAPNITSDSVKGVELEDDIDKKGKPIPVYGYVGPDAVIVDRNPNDPDAKPDYIKYDINVSVPVKILWAAFENGSVSPSSSKGEVVSPKYYIRNNAATSVNAVVYNFTARSGDANDNVDPYLILNLKGAGSINHTLYNKGAAFTAGTAFTGLARGNDWNFEITGTYDNTAATAFDTAYQPQYDLQFKFDVTP